MTRDTISEDGILDLNGARLSLSEISDHIGDRGEVQFAVRA